MQQHVACKSSTCPGSGSYTSLVTLDGVITRLLLVPSLIQPLLVHTAHVAVVHGCRGSVMLTDQSGNASTISWTSESKESVLRLLPSTSALTASGAGQHKGQAGSQMDSVHAFAHIIMKPGMHTGLVPFVSAGAAAYTEPSVYRTLPLTQTVLDTLRAVGGYDTFLAALKVSQPSSLRVSLYVKHSVSRPAHNYELANPHELADFVNVCAAAPISLPVSVSVPAHGPNMWGLW